MTVLKCTTEKSLQMPLILLLSVIPVMLSARNRQIALSVQCVVEKAAVDEVAAAEEVAVKVVEKVVVGATTTVKAGGNPNQVEVSLTIHVCVFVVVLRATKPRIARMHKSLQKVWKSEKKATLKAIKTSGLSRLLLMKKITESTLSCLLVLLTWTVLLLFLCTKVCLILAAPLIQ
jgi:hypothetical protein